MIRTQITLVKYNRDIILVRARNGGERRIINRSFGPRVDNINNRSNLYDIYLLPY